MGPAKILGVCILLMLIYIVEADVIEERDDDLVVTSTWSSVININSITYYGGIIRGD